MKKQVENSSGEGCGGQLFDAILFVAGAVAVASVVSWETTTTPIEDGCVDEHFLAYGDECLSESSGEDWLAHTTNNVIVRATKKASVTPTDGAAAAARNTNDSSESNRCTICFDDLTTETVESLECGHTYHQSCIRQWIRTRPVCPICQAVVTIPGANNGGARGSAVPPPECQGTGAFLTSPKRLTSIRHACGKGSTRRNRGLNGVTDVLMWKCPPKMGETRWVSPRSARRRRQEQRHQLEEKLFAQWQTRSGLCHRLQRF